MTGSEPSELSNITAIAAPAPIPTHISQIEEMSLPTSYHSRIKEFAEEAATREGIRADSAAAVFEAISQFGFRRELNLALDHVADPGMSETARKTLRAHVLHAVFPTIMDELYPDANLVSIDSKRPSQTPTSEETSKTPRVEAAIR